MTKRGENTVLWWVGWIFLTIASFFVSCFFWTGWIARHVGNMGQKNAEILWLTAVFGSWLLLLVPLIIVMYSKVDKAYEDARIAREKLSFEKEKSAWNVRSVLIEEKKRFLKPELAAKLKKIPQTIKHGHLVNVLLKNGRKIDHVFVLNKNEVMGVYDLATIDFEISDIVGLEPSNLDRLPAFETEKWWRFDGPEASG